MTGNRWRLLLLAIFVCLGGTMNATELPFAVMLPGTFTAGDDYLSEVTITRPFIIDCTVVTVADFRTFVVATGYRTAVDTIPDTSWRSPGYRYATDWPVTQVSLDDALRFANWRSRRDNLTPAYRLTADKAVWDREADGWRLPTEAEWEYAARCGGACGLEDAFVEIGRVDDVPAIDNGLRGMQDDVLEWCWDGYQVSRPDSTVDPVGIDSAGRRVIRGIGPGGREWATADFRAPWLGFRLVRSVREVDPLDRWHDRQLAETAQRFHEEEVAAVADSLWTVRHLAADPWRRVGAGVGAGGFLVSLIGWSMVSTGIDDDRLSDSEENLVDTGVTLLGAGVGVIIIGALVYLAGGSDLSFEEADQQARDLIQPPDLPSDDAALGLSFRF